MNEIHNCDWCGKQISIGWMHKRYGARFCNDECRTKYHNAKKKALRDERTAFMLVAWFQDMAKKEGELGQVASHALLMIGANAAAHVRSIRCKACGKSRFTLPSAGDKCAFCGKEEWSIK